jgi:hypothetical protein
MGRSSYFKEISFLSDENTGPKGKFMLSIMTGGFLPNFRYKPFFDKVKKKKRVRFFSKSERLDFSSGWV